MIRNAILTSLFIVPFTIAMGQVSFGVKGGMNLNRLVMTNLPEEYKQEVKDGSSSLLGYHVGIFSRIKLSDKFSIIPELQFIQKGYKSVIYYSGYSEEIRNRISYLEMPVALSYNPVKLLSVELGPSFGLNVGSKFISDNFKNSIDDFYEDFEFGLTGGLRFNLNEKLSLSGRYFYGLSSIGDVFFTDDGVNGVTTKMHNHNVQCSVYYVLK